VDNTTTSTTHLGGASPSTTSSATATNDNTETPVNTETTTTATAKTTLQPLGKFSNLRTFMAMSQEERREMHNICGPILHEIYSKVDILEQNTDDFEKLLEDKTSLPNKNYEAWLWLQKKMCNANMIGALERVIPVCLIHPTVPGLVIHMKACLNAQQKCWDENNSVWSTNREIHFYKNNWKLPLPSLVPSYCSDEDYHQWDTYFVNRQHNPTDEENIMIFNRWYGNKFKYPSLVVGRYDTTSTLLSSIPITPPPTPPLSPDPPLPPPLTPPLTTNPTPTPSPPQNRKRKQEEPRRLLRRRINWESNPSYASSSTTQQAHTKSTTKKSAKARPPPKKTVPKAHKSKRPAHGGGIKKPHRFRPGTGMKFVFSADLSNKLTVLFQWHLERYENIKKLQIC
jgi:hypothetical protein